MRPQVDVNGVFLKRPYSVDENFEKQISISPTTICLPPKDGSERKKRAQQGFLFTILWKCNKNVDRVTIP